MSETRPSRGSGARGLLSVGRPRGLGTPPDRRHSQRTTRAQARLLPDARRLHLHDGPIDLVIGASGSSRAVETAYGAASRRFVTVLDELCAELPILRGQACPGPWRTTGVVARRMEAAVAPFAAATFITPMAAVAGAVAEEILGAMTSAAPLSRAYVNNGGDIALHLAPGESLRAGIAERPDGPSLFGLAAIRSEDGIRGIATSGWRGRSFSCGIADAVTVLAGTAAMADAAATIVANAVDLPGHPAIVRMRACDVQCDSDLGQRLVTRGVGSLRHPEIDESLARGLACADELIARGLIRAAVLRLGKQTRLAEDVATVAVPSRRGA